MTNIVIIGGGAGGLGLATQLGKHFRSDTAVCVTLIDRFPTHIWKPLLHEVAAGVIDSSNDELNYRFHGYRKHFQFQLGNMTGVDRDNKDVILAPVLDEHGKEIMASRRVPYDYLVIAVGAVSNDFGIPGIKDHCYFLDHKPDAENFHHRLLSEHARLCQKEQGQRELDISIVGGGATGVELAAELVYAQRQLSHYGLADTDQVNFKITLIEAGKRILPALSESLAAAAHRSLEHLGVEILCNTQISSCNDTGFTSGDGTLINSDVRVWAAGVKGPEFIKTLGLSCTGNNRLVVNRFLQTEDEHIYAIGDCAAFTLPSGSLTPPRAQAAHQMASTAYLNILRQYRGRSLKAFQYKDFGSLVSLSRFDALGTLMGALVNDEMKIKGRLARIMYLSLYRMHQVAVHGMWYTLLLSIAGRINHWTKPRLKLH